MITWCNGLFFDAATPHLHSDDHGFVVGDGVFETVAVKARRPFALRRHLARLARSAAGLEIATEIAAIREAVEAVLAAPEAPEGLARLRITVSGGRSPLSSDRGPGPSTLVVSLQAADAPAATSSVVVVPWPRNERAATAGLKTTSYAENVLALRYARARGGSEAVFENTAGQLCEGTGSNIFLAVGGRLVTPPLGSGCLAGITRGLLLEWVGAVEEHLSIEDLRRAPEAFLASTMRDVSPIATVDGAALAQPPGPLTRRAAAVFAERAAADSEP